MNNKKIIAVCGVAAVFVPLISFAIPLPSDWWPQVLNLHFSEQQNTQVQRRSTPQETPLPRITTLQAPQSLPLPPTRSLFISGDNRPEPSPRRFDRAQSTKKIEERQRAREQEAKKIEQLEGRLYTANSDLLEFKLRPYVPSEELYTKSDNEGKIALLEEEIAQADAALSYARRLRGIKPKPWEAYLRRLPPQENRLVPIMPRLKPQFLR